jgi:hypothetical protein
MTFIIREPTGRVRFSEDLVLGDRMEVKETVSGVPELRGARHGQLGVSSSVELSDDWDGGRDLYIRCIPSLGLLLTEITLMDASTCVGLRITIRNLGTQKVYLNPKDGTSQSIEGSAGTFTLPAPRVTIQAVHLGGTEYGWEIVAQG